MSITLSELRTQARQLADMEDNEFVSDTELNNYINFAIADLHDLLVETYGSEYYLNSYESVTTNGESAYNLPSDFYKLRGVDAKLNGSDWLNLHPFNFNERHKYESFGSGSILGIYNLKYRVMGSKIRFTPTPNANTPFRLWYVPVATKLINDTDILEDVNQYSDYVILSAAIKMLNKEESDPSALLQERKKIEDRIEHAAQNRDAANPESISDIYAEFNDYLWYTSRG